MCLQKKTAVLIFASLILAACLQLMIPQSPSCYEEASFCPLPEDSLSPQGYQITGDAFLAVREDPQIYLNYSGALQLISVRLREAPEHPLEVSLYYALPGYTLSEYQRVTEVIYPTGDRCVLKVPFGMYEILRLDIGHSAGERFRLDCISVCDQQTGSAGLKRISLLSVTVLTAVIFYILRALQQFVNTHGIDSALLPEPESDLPAFYLKLAIPVGLLMCFLSMPLYVPDEGIHFLNSYMLSRGTIFPSVADGKVGKIIPQNLKEYLEYWEQFAFITEYEKLKFTITDLVNVGRSWSRDLTPVFYPAGAAALTPIGYLVSAAGMAVGRLLNPESLDSLPGNMLIYGRIANMLFFTVVTYLALKITPHYKRSMLILAVMPMNLFLSASLNPYALCIPVSFLLFAVALKLMDDCTGTICGKDIFAVLFCTFFLTAVKGVYALLLLLLLGIPREKYGSRRRLVFCVASVFAVGAIAYLPEIITGQIVKGTASEIQAARGLQLDYLIHNPLCIPQLLYNSLQKFGFFYLQSFAGNLGWLTFPFPSPALTLFYVSLILVAVIECCSSSDHPMTWKRLLPLLSVAIAVVAIFLSMSLHTAAVDGVGRNYIVGVQGRYFIPLALPFLLLCSNGFLLRTFRLRSLRSFADLYSKICALCWGSLTILLMIWRFF